MEVQGSPPLLQEIRAVLEDGDHHLTIFQFPIFSLQIQNLENQLCQYWNGTRKKQDKGSIYSNSSIYAHGFHKIQIANLRVQTTRHYLVVSLVAVILFVVFELLCCYFIVISHTYVQTVPRPLNITDVYTAVISCYDHSLEAIIIYCFTFAYNIQS